MGIGKVGEREGWRVEGWREGRLERGKVEKRDVWSEGGPPAACNLFMTQ